MAYRTNSDERLLVAFEKRTRKGSIGGDLNFSETHRLLMNADPLSFKSITRPPQTRFDFINEGVSPVVGFPWEQLLNHLL